MTDAPDTHENGTNDWTRAWFDFMGRMAAAGCSMPPENTPPAAARHMRDAFLKAMSASCDAYLRSPEFLQMMKTSMDSAIAFRTQLNEWLARAYREAHLPAREDVEVLAGRLQSVEKEILSRVDKLEQMLAAVLERLPAPEIVEEASVPPGPAASRRARPRPASTRRKSSRR